MTGRDLLSDSAPPSRGVAMALAFSVPGLGQAYAGYPLRGAAWAAAPVVVAISGLYATLRGYLSLTAAFWAVAVGVSLLVIGSLVDLWRMPLARFRPVSAANVLLHAALVMVGAPLVALGVRSTVAEAFKIPGASMTPTLLVGDHIFVDKLSMRAGAPSRGQLIVFRFPERPSQDFVKRVVAVGGDVLEVRDGHPIVNGAPVPRCSLGEARLGPEMTGDREVKGEVFVEQLGGHAYLTFFDAATAPSGLQGPFAVPAGEVWVMGDNRNNSYDSRQWFAGKGGGVPLGNIRGAAALVWLSLYPQGGARPGRIGVRLGKSPALPAGLEALSPALERCLRELATPR